VFKDSSGPITDLFPISEKAKALLVKTKAFTKEHVLPGEKVCIYRSHDHWKQDVF
jgi:hypothetical protein